MAAQVLSGSGNVSYTNSTGQNVRIVINYLETTDNCIISFAGVSVTFGKNGHTYGKTIGYRGAVDSGEASMSWDEGSNDVGTAIPLEIALANGDTFSITGSPTSTFVKGYNIIIIPEAG